MSVASPPVMSASSPPGASPYKVKRKSPPPRDSRAALCSLSRQPKDGGSRFLTIAYGIPILGGRAIRTLGGEGTGESQHGDNVMTQSEQSRESRSRLESFDPDVPRGLMERLRLTRLLKRFPQRPVWALFMFVNGFLTIAVLAPVAMLTNPATLFPSLGPTAFLFFFTPTAPTASPRNTLFGHAVGILCGYGSLVLFGLQDSPPANVMGVDAARVL